MSDKNIDPSRKFPPECYEIAKRVSLSISEHIRSVDPHRRKDFMAALIVAGRRRGVAVYDDPAFLADMAKHISDDIDSGKIGFIQDLSELTGKPDVENRQCSCLTALLDFHNQEERWPTKKELADRADEMFPDLFRDVDDKQWRRMRKDLGIDWLENSKTRKVRGA